MGGKPVDVEQDRPRVPRWRFTVELARRTVSEFFDDNCTHLAAAISYRVLFSIFPLAILLVAIFGITVRYTGLRADAIDTIVGQIPLSPDGRRSFEKLLRGVTTGFSALGFLSLIALVWGASGMMGAIRLGLNLAWDLEDTRPALRGKLVDVLLVFAVSLFMIASLMLTVLSAVVAHRAPEVFGPVIDASVAADWIIPILLAFVALVFLYRTVPDTKAPLSELWPGALFAAVVYQVAQRLFTVYLDHFSNFNAVYGSIGAVMAFLVFVYIASALLLLGAEIASEWPRARIAVLRPAEEAGPSLGARVWGFLRGLVLRSPRSGP